MSTKTLRKRIALATVAALGAGVLSLVSTSAANAYTGANDNTAAGDTASTAAAAGVMNIGTAKNVTGSAVNEDAHTGTGTTNSSVGLVNVSDIAGGLVAGTTSTAVLLSTGKLVVYTTATSSHHATFVVSGGTLTANSGAAGINSGSTVAYSNAATGGPSVFGVTVSPSSGATSMTVSMYDLGSTTASTTNYSSSGTLAGLINVTIASSSTA